MRSRPLAVEVLVAGWDDKADAPMLYWLDEIGAMQQVPYAVHGGQFPFIFSVLDRSGTRGDGGPSLKDVSLQDGLEIVESCWNVVRKRSGGSLDLSLFETYAVTRSGVEKRVKE
jgi:20S proteasome subunit beta 4